MGSVRGTFHQGNPLVFTPDVVGRQCYLIASFGILHHKEDSCLDWDSSDLDFILMSGSALLKQNYHSLPKGHLELLDALKLKYILGGKSFKPVGVYSYGGGIYSDNTIGSSTSLKEAISQTLHADGACITLGCNTVGLIFIKSEAGNVCQFALIDSHSRDERGNQVVDGLSCLLFFNNIQEVVAHIRGFAKYVIRDFSYDAINFVEQVPKEVEAVDTDSREGEGEAIGGTAHAHEGEAVEESDSVNTKHIEDYNFYN